MKERPILFSAPMVRAILEGCKTMTRRIVKKNESGRVQYSGHNWHLNDPDAVKACPYGQPGDRLWVRETFMPVIDPDKQAPHNKTFVYKATDEPGRYMNGFADKWRPSIHMPRIASRILLEITNVRVERLQEITRKDAVAEGCIERNEDGAWLGPEVAFCRLWESINGPGSWDADPWIWVVSFKRVKA